MSVQLLTTPAELDAYDAHTKSHPQGTLWQSVAWKKYQEGLGREVRLYGIENGQWTMDNERFLATAMVIIDRTMGGFSTWEIPRGPLWSEAEAGRQLLEHIIDDAKRDKCLALYLSPSVPLFTFHFSFFTSSRHIHPHATRILDLTQSEEQMMAQMHQKGRYNIGVARKEVTVREGSKNDVEAFYELLKGTGGRDRFVVSQKSHYARFLSDLEGSFLLLAEHQNRPIAGLLGVEWNGTGVYYYGASDYGHRNLMAPYLLQWHAMLRCKAHGCTRYDLLGISPEGAGPDDPWTGISDFKRKFGGVIVPYPPEQELVLRPVVKRALEWKRKIFG